MERDTVSITTDVEKHVVVIKSYLTARETRAIEHVFLAEAKVGAGGTLAEGLSGDIVSKAQDKLIEEAVVSVDGKTENVLELLLDFRKQDFLQVVKELDKISGGENYPKGQPSSPSAEK